jgi:RHS repeat-associated protein
METVADWNDAVTEYSYDDAGQLTGAVLPNGVVSTYTHDGADRLTGITHVKGQNTLASAAYTLDDVGNRTERVDQLGTHSYTYDDLYRLTEVTYPGPSTTSYTYDPVGNRETLVNGSGTTAYGYDNADQLTSVTPPGQQAIGYTWDDNGNLSERGADTYDWNAADRLTSATVGSATTDMAYNGDGLRDSRTVGEDTVTFTWDVAQSIPQVIDDGSLAYVYGLGHISQVAADDTTFYYLSDGLGSTMALTDADGDVVNTYNYDVFGEVRSQTGSQPNEFQFTGEQVDASTDLQYLRARYYDMATGSFMSRDLWLGNVLWPATLNLYPYVLNDPVNLVDPYGYFPWDKVKNVGGCALNPVGCAKSKVDEVLIDPLLERMPGGGAVKCVYHHGAVRCAADWAARQTARVLVGEKSYMDLNVTGGLFGLVGTGGLQFSYQGGLHPYAGGGVGAEGVAASMTVGPNQSISTGLGCGVQGTAPVYGAAGVTGQVGLGGLGGSGPSGFGEAGFYVGTPGGGWAATCYYVR